jgi:hypothetical protein
MRVMLAALLLAAIAPAAWGAARPQVRLSDASPATVAGTGFQARERVVVTVTAGSSRLSKAVVAGANGAFVARFAKAVSASGCGHVVIVAVGVQGDRASWKSAPQSCGTPPQPVTSGTSKASVAVSGTAPLTVSGRGFPAKTGVSLTVVVGTTQLQKLVAASATGAFTASWTDAETHGCRPSSVTAVSGGIRAVWRSPVRAACATVALP